MGFFLPGRLVDQLEVLGGGEPLGLRQYGQRVDTEVRQFQLGTRYGSCSVEGGVGISYRAFRSLVLRKLSLTVAARVKGLDRLEPIVSKSSASFPFQDQKPTNNQNNQNNHNNNSHNNQNSNSSISKSHPRFRAFFRPEAYDGQIEFDLAIGCDGSGSRIRSSVFNSQGTKFHSSAYWQVVMERPPLIDAHTRFDVWGNGVRLRWMPIENGKLLVSAVEPRAGAGTTHVQATSPRRFASTLAPLITCPQAEPIFAALDNEPDPDLLNRHPAARPSASSHSSTGTRCQIAYTRLHTSSIFYAYRNLHAAAIGPAASLVWPGFDVEATLEVEDALQLVAALKAMQGDPSKISTSLQAFAAEREARYTAVQKLISPLFQRSVRQFYFHRIQHLYRRLIFSNSKVSQLHHKLFDQQ